MEAGTAANQIPGEAVMRGTMRTLRNEACDAVEDAIRRVCAGVALSCDVQIEVGIAPRQSGDRERAGRTRPGRRGGGRGRTAAAARHGAGDDRRGFRLVSAAAPGRIRLDRQRPRRDGRELHNSSYDYNDAILPAAAGYLASVAKRALGK